MSVGRDSMLDEIALVIGHDAALALCHAFGGQYIYVPQAGQRRLRDRAIAQALAAGEPVRRVAARYGVTQRHALRIAARHKSQAPEESTP